MESLLYRNDTLSFMGVDPGTNQLGIGKLDVDPYTGLIVQSSAVTAIAEKQVDYDTDELLDSDRRRFKRLQYHERNLHYLFCLHQPVQIAVETNYISRATPSAYGPLVESVLTIRNAAYRYNEYVPILLIDPLSAKKSVNAVTRGLSKEDNKLEVWRSVGRMQSTFNIPKDMYESLSQHASDAIAIAYCAYLRWFEESRFNTSEKEDKKK